MPKKIPLQGEPIQGSDKPIITKPGENSKVPQAVIDKLEDEIQGVAFGGVSLIVAIRDGHRSYRIEKLISIMTGGNDGK